MENRLEDSGATASAIPGVHLMCGKTEKLVHDQCSSNVISLTQFGGADLNGLAVEEVPIV